MNFILVDRLDYLGSNFIVKISSFIYAHINKYNVLYTKNFPFHDSMYMKPFIDNGKEHQNEEIINLDYDDDVRINQIKPVIECKKDLITYFKENFKDEYYQILKKESEKRKYNIPDKDYICLHLRLFDGRKHDGSDYKDYDGSGSADFVKELIDKDSSDFEKDKMIEYCKKKGIKWGVLAHPDKQCAMDLNNFKNMLLELKEKNPEKEIYVVTNLNNQRSNRNSKYINFCKKNNIKIQASDDPDYDLWFMIHSHTLILSKSTYSLVAAYYHQGVEVIYPLWGTFAASGLYSKYDQTGWKYYI